MEKEITDDCFRFYYNTDSYSSISLDFLPVMQKVAGSSPVILALF